MATLQNITTITSPNSEIVMDYSINYKELHGVERIGSFAIAQFTHFFKEPLMGAFESKNLHEAVENMGYIILEDLSGTDITKRYFHKRSDHIRHTEATHLIHLQIA